MVSIDLLDSVINNKSADILLFNGFIYIIFERKIYVCDLLL